MNTPCLMLKQTNEHHHLWHFPREGESGSNLRAEVQAEDEEAVDRYWDAHNDVQEERYHLTTMGPKTSGGESDEEGTTLNKRPRPVQARLYTT